MLINTYRLHHLLPVTCALLLLHERLIMKLSVCTHICIYGMYTTVLYLHDAFHMALLFDFQQRSKLQPIVHLLGKYGAMPKPAELEAQLAQQLRSVQAQAAQLVGAVNKGTYRKGKAVQGYNASTVSI